MANNYLQASACLKLPEHKLKLGHELFQKIVNELETKGDNVDLQCEFDDAGIWIYGEEYVSPEQVEYIVSRVQNELELDETFIFSYAYTCSKMRVDEFGGGAFACRRGYPTQWCDAYSTVVSRMKALVDQ